MRFIARWSPTLVYAVIIVAICLRHNEKMKPVVDVLGLAEKAFVDTKAGLERGEALSPEAQIELSRVGAHHTHHSAVFVRWTTRAFWWLTMPGIVAAVLQGAVCSRWPARVLHRSVS